MTFIFYSKRKPLKMSAQIEEKKQTTAEMSDTANAPVKKRIIKVKRQKAAEPVEEKKQTTPKEDQKTATVIIVLPTIGQPYIWKASQYEKKDVKIRNKEVCKVVQGTVVFDCIDNLIIHPMFSNRWKLVSQLLSNKKHREKVSLCVNANGLNDCCLNMACINRMAFSPYAGELALIVPVSIFNDKISLKMFKPVKLPNQKDDELMGVFEADDEEEMETMQKWATENGYDYNYRTGQIFEKETGLKDE